VGFKSSIDSRKRFERKCSCLERKMDGYSYEETAERTGLLLSDESNGDGRKFRIIANRLCAGPALSGCQNLWR